MKRIWALLTIVFFIGFTQNSFGQKKSDGDIIISCDKIVLDNGPQFVCKKIIYDDEGQIMTLIDHVSFKNNKFELDNAGKVVYNQKTKKLTIYNCKRFTIDGKVVTKLGNQGKGIVEYTLGDDTVYML